MTVHTDRLGLYNKALRHLGERKLASLTDDSEARYYLDDEYDEALLFCLRQAFWNFAIRAASIDASTDITPSFGYRYAFEKPADWVKTLLVSSDQYFNLPLTDYQDEHGYWLSNLTPMYLRYISGTLGVDPVMFPPDYAEYVGVYLGSLILPRITQKSAPEVEAMEKKVDRFRKVAQANDAIDQPPGHRPLGSWVTSRSRRGGQLDYPSGGSLIP